uniref:NADH-ubiquinone oxidoreductase chain 4 n=1 Tax=Physaloptera rara TaxID=2358290 RepID=A0A4Y6I486_9BILA|nr:NADH dehydrogenase subunit 4 [Physaloptera rara]
MFISLFLSVLFMNYYFLFLLVLLMFVLGGIWCCFWSGGLFFYDSYGFLVLALMSILVMGFINYFEVDKFLGFSVCWVIYFSLLFFFSNNMMILYIFYELTLIPVLFSILGYGRQVEKIGASYYLVFYTFFFGFPYLFIYSRVCDFFDFVYFDFFLGFEYALVLSFCFLVKFPIYFFHIWLPKAHVEAPTSISMVLAGVMLKLGGAGVLRISKCLSFSFLEFWILLSLVSMTVSSFICMFQSDSKSLAAYSSICHMGFVLLAEVSFMYFAKSMGVVMMLSHGFTSVMMFYFIGEFFHVSGSRMVYYMRGYFNTSSLMSLFFCLTFMSNFSFPFCITFFSEYVMINYWGFLYVISLGFLFFYYMISFYYSIYMLVVFVFGSNFYESKEGAVLVSLPMVFMMYNFFWFLVII